MNDTIQDATSSAERDEAPDQEPDRAAATVTIDPPSHAPAAVLSLKQAMRRARFDDAERSGAMADLRVARLGRLEVLQDALKPLVAQIPADVDCFDIGIMPGANPRLFVDMIGFVEMARDPRVYRFLQDTRHGRIKLAESESVDKIVEAATQYVARRLLERDKALASDGDREPVRRAAPVSRRPKSADAARGLEPTQAQAQAKVQAKGQDMPRGASRSRTAAQMMGLVFAFLIDVLGSIAFFSLVAFAAWVIWSNFKH